MKVNSVPCSHAGHVTTEGSLDSAGSQLELELSATEQYWQQGNLQPVTAGKTTCQEPYSGSYN